MANSEYQFYKNISKDLQKQTKEAERIAKKAYAKTTAGKQAKLQKQIDNLTTRMNAGGVSTEKVKDTRNPVEKFLGLKENQNFVFDVFELLGRPQQALFGATHALQKGEDPGKAAWEHFKGDKETSYKDLWTEAGMKDRKGKVDPVDVLGFAGDVLLDPLDLALIPFTGGASVAAKGSSATAKTAKTAKTLDKVSDVAKAAKTIDKVSDTTRAIKAADKVADAAKSKIVFKSVNDLLFQGAGKAIKGGAKITDKGIEKLLKAADKAKGIEYANLGAKSASNLGKELTEKGAEKLAKKLGKAVNEVSESNVVGKLESYKDVKDQISRLFNTASNIPKTIKDALRKNNADSVRAAKELRPIYDDLEKSINQYAYKVAEKMGDTSDETVRKIAEKADKNILNRKEFKNLNREVTMADIIKEAKNGTLKYSDAGDLIIDKLKNIADDINKADRGAKLTVDVTKDGYVKLSKSWDWVNNPTQKQYNKLVKEFTKENADELASLRLDDKKLAEKVTKKGNYTQADLDELADIEKLYNKDKDFKALYDKADNIFNRANEVVDRHFGTDLATKYKDNAGYVRHAYNKDLFNKKLGFVDEYGDIKFKGSAKVLGERTYNMSAREANNLFRETITKNLDDLDDAQRKAVDKLLKQDGLFSEGITKSFTSYLENVPKLAKDNKNLDTVLVKSTFGDYKELKSIDKELRAAKKSGDTKLVEKLQAQKIEKLNNSNVKVLTRKDNKIPIGFEKLNGNTAKALAKKLTDISSELGIKDMEDIAKYVRNNGGKMAINKDVLRLVEVGANKNETKGLVRLYDRYLNYFKKWKVVSPSFQINNFLGNSSNMFLGGISPTKQARLFPEAAVIMNKSDKLMNKLSEVSLKTGRTVDDILKNGAKELSKREQKMLKIWNGFIDAGFGDPKSLTALDLADMPDGLKKYFNGEKQLKNVKDFVKDGLPYLNNKMNNYMDTMARLATYIEGTRNTKFLSKLGVDNAGDAVRKILFDPSDLTDFERNKMKRIMPFYTFTKKNLAFQISNLSKNGSQYNKLMKGYNKLLDAATDDNSENVSDWLKNNLYIPIPGIGKDGSYKVLRGSLPFGNLIDTLDNPISAGTNLLSPTLRLPVELATGKNAFTGNDIEKFPGQLSTNIPGLTKKQEYLLGNLTGLDVPIKSGYKAYQGIQDTMSGGNTFQALENVGTISNNIETDKLNRMYDQLESLENMMKQYEQKGYQFSTINELKQANKRPTVDKINTKLKKINNIRNNPYSQQFNSYKKQLLANKEKTRIS